MNKVELAINPSDARTKRLLDDLSATIDQADRGFALFSHAYGAVTPSNKRITSRSLPEITHSSFQKIFGEKSLVWLEDALPDSSGPAAFPQKLLRSTLQTADTVTFWTAGLTQDTHEFLSRLVRDDHRPRLVVVVTVPARLRLWTETANRYAPSAARVDL